MSELSIGRSLGPYEVVEEIGRGGMAAVYKARQASLDRFVALKVLAAHLAHDPDFVARFTREATIAARLEHPHIVPIYDVGEVDGQFYIAMRFINGRSLSEVIRTEGPLPVQRAIVILDQIAGALDHAHRHGVVHRDLKPGNVLLEEDDRAYLADFGIARAGDATHVTRMGTLVGTPRYMSPEQAQGLEADYRADLYAFGVIAFELLTGQTPFRADSVATLLHQHVYEPPPPLRSVRPELPERLEGAITRMLAKDPDARFPSANAFVRALVEGPHTETMVQPVAAAPKPTAVAPTKVTPPRTGGAAAGPAPVRSAKKGSFPFIGVFAAVVVVAIAGVGLLSGFSLIGGNTPSEAGTSPAGVSTPTEVAEQAGSGGTAPTAATSPTANATGSPQSGGVPPTSTPPRAGTPTATSGQPTPTQRGGSPPTATAPVAVPPTATTVLPPRATATPTEVRVATPTVAQETPVVHEPTATPTVETEPPTHTPTVAVEPPTATPTVEMEPPTPTLPAVSPTTVATPTMVATATTTTNAAAESPTAVACRELANPALLVSVQPDRRVSLGWNSTGGCGPFNGTIEARYEGEAAPYAVHQIGTQAGNRIDSPPPRCGGPKTLVYTLTLGDRTGQEVTRTTEASITWPC